MDTDLWLSSFRYKILNTEIDCFNGLLQYCPLPELSYPNQLLMKLLWPNFKLKTCSPLPRKEKRNPPKLLNWMSEYPSLWNELRYLTHCGIKQIIRTQKCPKIVIDSLLKDGNQITNQEFKRFWMEIYEALAFNQNECTSNNIYPKTTEVNTEKSTLEQGKDLNLKKQSQMETKSKENLNEIPRKPDKTLKMKSSILSNQAREQTDVKSENFNQETLFLHNKNDENQWKSQMILEKLAILEKNFNKLNFAYLFIRNYNILQMSELIRKNLKIECSRPTKFNYYNILTADRIYQEKLKIVKGNIKQYKYKRRTRAMSMDDNENTIWTPKNKKKIEEYEIENDRINIMCEIQTAIVNHNQGELLRLSVDKRFKLANMQELEKMGYFKAIQNTENLNRKDDSKKDDASAIKQNK